MKRLIALMLFVAVSCSGATTIFMESGTDATQDFTFYSSTSGTVTSDSSAPITGTRSILLNTSSPATLAFANSPAATMADAGRRITFRCKFDTIPAADAVIFQVRNASSNNVLQLGVNSTANLKLLNTGVISVTGTTVLRVNTVYRVAFSYIITSASVWTVNVFLNGKLEITQNSGTLTNTTGTNFRLTVAAAAGANVKFWFDDVFLDNGTDLADPGNIIVTNKRPNANGAANGFTTQIGAGGSGYGTGHSPQVNEQPLSTTNGWSIASASALTEQYTIEGAATGDVDVSRRDYSLVDYMGWIDAKTASAGTRNIVLAGVATNITTTTSFALYTKVAGSTTYPSTNTAIGMNNNSVNNLTSLAECGILLAYKLPRRISITP